MTLWDTFHILVHSLPAGCNYSTYVRIEVYGILLDGINETVHSENVRTYSSYREECLDILRGKHSLSEEERIIRCVPRTKALLLLFYAEKN